MTYDDRQHKNILVVEAQAIGMIGVIRGLGQAGYRVIAISGNETALGLNSNYAAASYVCPSYSDKNFLGWLREFIAEQKIDAIIPSEGFLLAIYPDFDHYKNLIPGHVDKETIYKCLCKSDVFHSFISAQEQSPVRRHIPETIVVTGNDTVPDVDQLKKLGLPIWIKVDAYYARGQGYSGEIVRADSFDQARKTIVDLLPKADKILVQSHEKGVKATVNICMDNGRLLARSECVATHENPHTGGLTSLRHNWVHEEMFQDAMERIKHLGWDGVAMMEYKWDEQAKKFCFIEMNSRYWAALHLDLFTGINFPEIQVDAFFGLAVDPVLKPGRFLTARNAIPSDFGHMLSRVRDKNLPAIDKIGSFVGFFLLFLNPAIKADLLYPGDRKLYWLQLRNFLSDLMK